MSRYAEGTEVTVGRSREELETLLAKHGASQRLIATDDEGGRALVQFRLCERMIRLEIRTQRSKLDPSRGSRSQNAPSARAPHGWDSWTVQRRREWLTAQGEQAEREAWRRLLLVVKGKLELIADSMSTVEREFLADILLPNGTTVGDALAPQLAETYRSGAMPPLLPPASGPQ